MCGVADASGWQMFERRLGMFVHWGIYSVNGYHEQERMRKHLGRAEYEKAIEGFAAERFDADKWIDVAESAGAEYIVFTAKHHDGFCMWDTKVSEFKVTNSPAKRDVLKELADACRRRGMKLGLYYSNPDWHHPNAYNSRSTHQILPEERDAPDLVKYREYVKSQITELLTNYGEIVCLFWDIPTKVAAPEMDELVRRLQPGIRINDRGWGNKGDYSTPERGIPDGAAFSQPTEACDSVGAQSWGYRTNEDYHTVGYLTRAIDRTLSRGGNFLLNVGPKSNGEIPEEAVALMMKVGEWYSKVRESYRDVRTVTDMVDEEGCVLTCRGDTAYLHFTKGLQSTGIDLKPMRTQPRSVVLLNTGTHLESSVEKLPMNWEGLVESLHLRGIPADNLANESVVIRMDGVRPPCSLSEYANHVRIVNGTNVWTEALQAAIDENEIVRIPPASERYYIDRPVVIPSHRRILAHGATIRLLNGTRTLMLRNASAQDGTLAPITGTRDCDIEICGGRWEDCRSGRCGYGNSGMFNLLPRKRGNFFGVSTLFYFGNANGITIRDITFADCGAFAVQSGDGECHRYENITFENCHVDGLHLNGNLSHVRVKNVRGEVGDDLVALNAYDWQRSSVNFGPQSDIVCEDLELTKGYPAIRIQPAAYRYADGTKVDCSVNGIVFRRVKGIKTFKMYLQTPRYEIGTRPEWGEVGSGGNILFEDIKIDLTGPIDDIFQYHDSDPIRGHFAAFEIGANIRSVMLRNVDVAFHADRWPRSHLVTIGPKSAICEEKNGKKCEIFDPYVNCVVDALRIEGLRMRDVEPSELVKEIKFEDVNHDGLSSGMGKVKTLLWE